MEGEMRGIGYKAHIYMFKNRVETVLLKGHDTMATLFLHQDSMVVAVVTIGTVNLRANGLKLLICFPVTS